DLILIGAYEAGTDPRVDYAIEKIEEVNAFLKQGIEESAGFDGTLSQLKEMFG
ncbi:MAG: EscN/YscN/HrcN family type III secretion system ATPase, partial [Deltaproteobacteria bacterium]|nr:EscN/YscN/HrcN family type III secretion system ATPase [Deltaproteobacteria bacterium]